MKRTSWVFIPPLFYIPWFIVFDLAAFLIAAGLAFWVFSPPLFFPISFFVFIPLAAAFYFLFFFLTMIHRQAFYLDTWEDRKKRWLKVDENFEMKPDEKIIVPLTPCFIRKTSLLSFEYITRDIIVTNRRILYGFLIFRLKETFGQMNFWRLGVNEMPSTALNVLGANTKIEKIEYGKDKNLGDYIKIKPRYIGRIAFTIYHPQARQIYEIFSQPLR